MATRSPKRGKKEPRAYHHGSLPEAFLKAAERVLRRDGISGLTVRATSREVGVSHTAARHHFSDLSGILSELAAEGHRRLTATLAAHAANIASGPSRRKALGKGYIAFALANPDLFRLMSRNDLLDYSRTALQVALQASSRALAGVFDVSAEVNADVFTPLAVDQALTIAGGWGLVHGLANLLIDGRLNRLAAGTAGAPSPMELIEQVLVRTALGLTEMKPSTAT